MPVCSWVLFGVVLSLLCFQHIGVVPYLPFLCVRAQLLTHVTSSIIERGEFKPSDRLVIAAVNGPDPSE